MVDEVPGPTPPDLPEFFGEEKVVGMQNGQLMTEDLDGSLHFKEVEPEALEVQIFREEVLFEAQEIIHGR